MSARRKQLDMFGEAKELPHPSLDRLSAIQVRILAELKGVPRGLTTDETAIRINRTVLAVRPVFTGLQALGLIEKTERKRLNISGQNANVWQLTDTPSTKSIIEKIQEAP